MSSLLQSVLLMVLIVSPINHIIKRDTSRDTIIIMEDLNLKGTVWEIPKGKVIIVKQDIKIKNGEIKFNQNSIIAGKNCFGKDVKFSGSISCDVDINWFTILYDSQYDNSVVLNNALILASISRKKILKLNPNSIIYVKSHYDDFNVERNSNIKYLRKGTVTIPSNTTLDLNGSEIRCIPNDKAQYNILFSRETKNVVIKNGTIKGDAKSHSYGLESDEWGYGIELQGVEDFSIENVKCIDCIGDGIDLQASITISDGNIIKVTNCRNGTILASVCENNGRNSMSIQGCENLLIKKCDFNTACRTAPRAGIDIEPSISFGKVKNVSIVGCRFINNATYGIMIQKSYMSASIENILVDDCRFDSSGCNYHILCNGGSNVTITDSEFKSDVKEEFQIRLCNTERISINHNKSTVNNGMSIQMDGDEKKVSISYCDISSFRIHSYSKMGNFEDITFSHCFFKNEGLRYALMEHSSCVNKLVISFDNCTFDFSDATFSNNSKNVFLFPIKNDVIYKFYGCRFLGNGAIITLSKSVDISNSHIYNVQLIVNIVEEQDNVFFHKNTLSYIEIPQNNNALIYIMNNKSKNFHLDITGLTIKSACKRVSYILDGDFGKRSKIVAKNVHSTLGISIKK